MAEADRDRIDRPARIVVLAQPARGFIQLGARIGAFEAVALEDLDPLSSTAWQVIFAGIANLAFALARTVISRT